MQFKLIMWSHSCTVRSSAKSLQAAAAAAAAAARKMAASRAAYHLTLAFSPVQSSSSVNESRKLKPGLRNAAWKTVLVKHA